MSRNYLIKPTVKTKFYIDYSWWENSPDDLQVYLLTHLTPEQQQALANQDLSEVFDYVDPETGEIFQLDRLSLAIQESSGARRFYRRKHQLNRQRVSGAAGQ